METPFDRRRVARIAVWVQAIGLMVLGIILTSVRTYTPWTDVANGDGRVSYTSEGSLDIWPIGLGLLCVGLLLLGVLLIVAAYGRPVGEPAEQGELMREFDASA